MYIPDIFNNILPYLQNLYGGAQGGRPTYTPSGSIYNGPFKNDNRTPFRTVAPVQEGGYQPAYNRGLNASSAQLYDHFRSKPGKTANDYGLAYAGATQSFDDFLNRGKPKPPMPADTNPPPYDGGPVPPFKFPTAGFGSNFNGFLGNLNSPGIFNFTPEQLAQMDQR